MAILDWGIKILLILTIIFFLIFFSLCSYWAKPEHPEKRIAIGFLVSIFYTFLFFLVGKFLLFLIFLFLKLFELWRS